MFRLTVQTSGYCVQNIQRSHKNNTVFKFFNEGPEIPVTLLKAHYDILATVPKIGTLNVLNLGTNTATP
jgi:hypothetical protein